MECERASIDQLISELAIPGVNIWTDNSSLDILRMAWIGLSALIIVQTASVY